ncbi:hypothetical protein LSTR_LSTR001468 [Laodelphax striatellus]|uniref:Uncharacterized protein n=1 Tax=Laodelphax striatellus TaxID=195883 RepID=A0A482XAD3_LAOST|nr:hypothetical protein LSTR_LSTR001468 [Laodelphax striatellus]
MSTYSKRIIKGWKRLLLSEEEKNKIKAAQEILQHINNLKRAEAIERFLINIIDQDFVEFFCRSMETWNFKLMRLMYTILFNLFGTRKFFEEYSRVLLVHDSLMRNIHSFFKMKPSSTILSLDLMTQLIARTRHYSIKDFYRPEKLLQLLEMLTNNPEYISEAKSPIFKLTYALLCDVIEKTPSKLDMSALKSLAFRAGILLYKEIENSELEEYKKKSANLMCKMMTKMLRCVQVDGKHTIKITQHIMKSCLSLKSFPKMNSCETRLALRICEYFIIVAKSFNDKFVIWLVNFITENGFLMFFLHHFQASGKNINMKDSFLKVLQMCVKILSDGNGQGDKFVFVIHEGLSKIAAASSCALEMEKPNFSSIQFAIVIILYYHFSNCTLVKDKLTISSPVKNEVLLKENILLKIFSSITTTNSSILKMLIFLYAASAIDSGITDNERMKHSGYKRLLKLISSSNKLEELYSDHRIFIQWIVSSESLPENFKACAITQWLTRRGDEDTYLEIVIERNANALSLLLKMLCWCKEQILGPLLRILVKYQIKQTRRNDKSMQKKIWKNLNKVIEYYMKNPKKAHNLAAYMKLASTDNPSLKADDMIQVASKLLRVMDAQTRNLNSLLTVAMFSLVRILINNFISEGEERGALIFFKTEVIINLIKVTMFHEDIHLACASADLITFLSNVQRDNNFMSEDSIQVSLESIRKESTKSFVHSFNCVRLYNSCIETKTVKPFIVIETIPQENRQKMCCKLYLNFLNISFMITSDCHFSSHQMLLFLAAWLTRLAPVVWRWTQLSFMYSLLLDQIAETATVLAKKTIQQSILVRPETGEKDDNIKQYKFILKMILNLNIDLPPEIGNQFDKISDCL